MQRRSYNLEKPFIRPASKCILFTIFKQPGIARPVPS
jgi:hypothetical protein